MPSLAKVAVRPYKMKFGHVAQVAENLPSMCKTLGSTSALQRKKNRIFLLCGVVEMRCHYVAQKFMSLSDSPVSAS
jgi:hypothetical protein